MYIAAGMIWCWLTKKLFPVVDSNNNIMTTISRPKSIGNVFIMLNTRIAHKGLLYTKQKANITKYVIK